MEGHSKIHWSLGRYCHQGSNCSLQTGTLTLALFWNLSLFTSVIPLPEETCFSFASKRHEAQGGCFKLTKLKSCSTLENSSVWKPKPNVNSLPVCKLNFYVTQAQSYISYVSYVCLYANRKECAGTVLSHIWVFYVMLLRGSSFCIWVGKASLAS